ncbi:MAG: trehalose-phosphatase [Magnetococcus sp. WYHC-3]
MNSPLPLPDPDNPDWALFLDIDGTLVALADHPEAAVASPELVPLLTQLRAALGGALALISGRSLASQKLLLRTDLLDAAGCHGAETRMGGHIQVHAPTQQNIHPIVQRLGKLVTGIPSTLIEVKPHAIAFHYRAPALDASRARQLLTAALAEDRAAFRLLEGKNVLEALPVGIGKGEAIALFLRHAPYAGRLPVFVGDDVTDEEGFVEVNRRQGHSIRVGAASATVAGYHVASVREVLAWLRGPVCARLGCGQPGEWS